MKKIAADELAARDHRDDPATGMHAAVARRSGAPSRPSATATVTSLPPETGAAPSWARRPEALRDSGLDSLDYLPDD